MANLTNKKERMWYVKTYMFNDILVLLLRDLVKLKTASIPVARICSLVAIVTLKKKPKGQSE